MNHDDFENLGYIEFNGAPYTYYFNREEFRLTLIPKGAEEQKGLYFKMFESLGKAPDRDEWIKSNIVMGDPLGKNSGIVFSLLDNPSTYNGIAQYPVNWYLELPDGADIEKIDGIEVIGGDVNRFYSPNHALERELTTDAYTVKTSRQDDAACGTFELDSGIICTASVSAYGSMNFQSFETPIYATSRLKLEFSSPVSLKEVVELYQNGILSLFMFLNYRGNISFDKVRLIWRTPMEGHPNYLSSGEIHFPPRDLPPDDKKKQEKTIKFEIIGDKTANLISYFHQGKASLEYITESAIKRSSYPPSRMIAICTEFEREFRNVYGTDALRHEEYKQAKEEVAGWLTERADAESGKKRQYLKSFARSISNLDDSYGQRVKHVIEDNEEIIMPFIDATFTGGLSDMKDGIPDRLNDLRNGFMHSRLDLELEPVNISDINILEILIYVIVLRQFIEPDMVMRAVNELFGYHVKIAIGSKDQSGADSNNKQKEIRKEMNIIGVIPSRYASTRFPGKPLVDICGHPMIWWVYQQVIQVKELSKVFVATDDERISKVCDDYGIPYIMTRNDHVNHVTRLQEVSDKVEADYYVCVNGDEPLIQPENIRNVLPDKLVKDEEYAGYLMRDLTDPAETIDPSNIKLTVADDGRCIYMSRTPIPYPKGSLNITYKKLIGIECFNKKALDFYASTPMGKFEKIEDIDHLRFIENGKMVIIKQTEGESLSVDTQHDLEKVRTIMSERLKKQETECEGN